jgi:hypothetical protein
MRSLRPRRWCVHLTQTVSAPEWTLPVHGLFPASAPFDTFEIVTVASGARSLRSQRHGETFHPVVGPMAEAHGLHVAQQRLVERAGEKKAGPLVVWDVGLGAAANALAVLEALRGVTAPVELHSFDRSLEPLEFALQHAADLGYLVGWEDQLRTVVREGVISIGSLTWRMHVGDFRDRVHDATAPAPHAVIFDPYSPSANPELWNVETFAAIRARVKADEPCLLTSYSRSTAVRVTLLLAGWFVGRGTSTGEKDETTVASSHRESLASPLEPAWIERVRRSTAPGPLQRDAAEPSPTSIEVADELSRHPQFATA